MTPLDIAQAIITDLIAESNTDANLQLIASRLYIQHVPPSAILPHLRISIGKIQHESHASQKTDLAGTFRISLISSLSGGAQQMTAIQNALISKLNQKQLLISPGHLLQIWLDQTHEPDVEHDRIELSSIWQCRLTR